MCEKNNKQFEDVNFLLETMMKDRHDDTPIERDRFPFWNTGEVQSFTPDLDSGCIFSPEYAEIQRKKRRQGNSNSDTYAKLVVHMQGLK